MDETKELIQTLLRRDDVLEEIQGGAIRIRELTERVGVSRPTVHRSLQELSAQQLVRETESGYVLTSYGEWVVERYSGLLADFENLHSNKEVLLALGNSSLPEVVLKDASFTRSYPYAPERPLDEFEAVVKRASEIKAFSPVIIERFIRFFYREVTVEGLEIEALVTTDVFEYLLSRWTDELHGAVGSGLQVAITDSQLPYGLIVAEKPEPELCMVIYEEGTFRGIITTTNSAAVDWGRQEYESYREAANRPELPAA